MDHTSMYEAPIADGPAPAREAQDELVGLYRALQYLEQKAHLLGLRLVSVIIGVAAMGTKEIVEGRNLKS